MTDSGASGGSSTDISSVATDLFLAVEMKHSAWLITASLFILISLACLLLSLLHHRCRSDYDFESLAPIEIATVPHHSERNKIIDINHHDASFPIARTVSAMGIRKRTTRGNRQGVQDEASIDNRPVGEETVPYSIARFLSEPGKEGTIKELHYFS